MVCLLEAGERYGLITDLGRFAGYADCPCDLLAQGLALNKVRGEWQIKEPLSWCAAA